MSWLKFFQTTQKNCKINFGRGINADIASNEEELFYKSYEAFEKNDIVNAYEYFFYSIVNYNKQISNKNVVLKIMDGIINFELFQGSAKIQGTITQKSLYAEVIIVRKENATVSLKRYILERNYQLTYANYYSDDKYIKLKLYQDNISLTPQKIFFPLRELALNADFDKEHIKSEFTEIPLEDITHLSNSNPILLKTKYEYINLWIQELEAKVLTLPSNDNSGMQSFLYLNILFKIDYLLTPKYKMFQQLSKKIQEYFGNEHATTEAKNEELKRYVLKLKQLSFKEFSDNFYIAKYTFNPIEKSSYDNIVTFINESQTKIRWYKNNRYAQVIPTIYNYIAFYSLYNYGMNSVLKELFYILVNIQNSSFFTDIGCTPLYNEKTQSFSKRLIISKIKSIIEENHKKYTKLTIHIEELNFSSLDEFCNSYYTMLKNLNFEEK